MFQLKSARGDTTQHYANLNDYTRNGYPAAQMVGKFWQIDEKIYDHALEELPPEYCAGGFRCIERLTGDIAATYFKLGGGYWCAMTDLDVTHPAKMVKAIVRHLMKEHAR